MNKIRNTIVTAAIAGGAILGVADLTGVVDAATDGESPVTFEATGGPSNDGDTLTADERQDRRNERRAVRQADRQAVADLLGLDVAELHEQLHAGATLADVAAAQGVATSDVVDLIVQQLTERIDGAVEDGRITAEEAAEKIAELDERVQTRVEEGRPERGDGEGRRGGRGHHGAGADAEG